MLYKGILLHDGSLNEDREVVDLEWSLKRWVLVTQLPTTTNDEDPIGPEALESVEVLELTLHDDRYLVMGVRDSKGEAGEP